MRNDGAGLQRPVWQRERVWRRRRRGIGLAVVIALIQLMGVRAAAGQQSGARALEALGYLLLVGGPALLVWRRRLPVPVLAGTLAATLGYALAGYPRGPFFLAATVAVFTAVVTGRRAAAAALAALGYVGYLVLGWLLADRIGLPSPARPDLGDALAVALWLVVLFALGEAARVRAQHFAEVAKSRAEHARARAEQERRQASEERLRMARELHDVLGHHLSLINVQAGVGLHLMDSRPEQARAALTAIKTASAEALREVRSVLGVLRPDEEGAPRGPAPTLDRLVDLTTDAGFPVQTRVHGQARPLPAAVDRAGYRIVQEALTNVRRHAGPHATATVTLRYDDDALVVTVVDDGRGGHSGEPAAAGNGARDGAGNGAGSGIAGMRARAESLGGTLVAGPAPEGGFRVDARLPTGAVS
ncbi:MAG TPA: sensor histidine kinase [Micromonosporaceae bacterium]|nr:sensor histidine kinase [Micromonosporaceae bacterium]